MKAHQASLINAILLIGLSLWGYFGSETPSKTAFIPTIVGVLLLAMNPGVRKENKVIAHIAVILTFVILLGLIKPFIGAVSRVDYSAELRIGVMLVSTIFALGAFMRSFMRNRKARKSAA
jgi:uncharacterized membrane protein